MSRAPRARSTAQYIVSDPRTRHCAIDATLSAPKLILHALQVNIAGGRLPDPEGNGRRYLKIPLGVFQGAAWP